MYTVLSGFAAFCKNTLLGTGKRINLSLFVGSEFRRQHDIFFQLLHGIVLVDIACFTVTPNSSEIRTQSFIALMEERPAYKSWCRFRRSRFLLLGPQCQRSSSALEFPALSDFWAAPRAWAMLFCQFFHSVLKAFFQLDETSGTM